MSIRVEDAMIRKVFTVEPDLPLKYAAKLMDYLRVSSLVVVEDDKIRGILTEHDLVTRIVAKGQDPEKLRVKDVMSMPVVTVNPEMNLELAIQLMSYNGVKKIPVVTGNGEELVGIISLTDIARLFPHVYSKTMEFQNVLVPLGKEPTLDYIQ